MKIGTISLGCDKNRMDTENMLYLLQQAGHKLVENLEEADIALINTCGFIEKAKKEGISAIVETVRLKTDGKIKRIVVTGCLAERYSKELFEGFGEVDAFVGVQSENNIVEIINRLDENIRKLEKQKESREYVCGRVLTTPGHYAYLRIADGCNNHCSYCAIPAIRGKYRSVPIDKLVSEAEMLVSRGVKEIILVAQDTTYYGTDLYGKPTLTALLKELIKLNVWKIRLLYTYPELIDDKLIKMVAEEEKIAKYLDMPLQHIDDYILKRMNRKSSSKGIKELLNKIKSANNEIAVRSTFIVGFNGEDEEKYNALKEFIADNNEIDYAGFFGYSVEEGTPASNFKEGNIKKGIIKKRVTELEKIMCVKVNENHKKYLGRVVEVVYEGIDYKKQCFYGRLEQNAPDIDTKVFFISDFSLEIGNIYKAEITETGFNLSGKIIGE